jgi:hypothetical protein
MLYRQKRHGYKIMDRMGEACCTDRRDMDTKFLLESPKGKYTFGQLCINERIILKLILKKQGRYLCMDWSHLAQYRKWWQALVDMVMNF